LGVFGEREGDGGGGSLRGASVNGGHTVNGVNGVNGVAVGEGKRNRKPGGGVVGRRVGNSGVVMVTGLNPALMGKRFGGDG
jgi:hypothetical protein